MAVSLLRVGLVGPKLQACAFKLMPAIVQTQSKAGITCKALKKPRNVKPFPYETQKYNLWRSLFDDTEARFDENTKIIVVEGNVAAGKTTLAKKLAEDLDFFHFPEANIGDMMFIDHNGFDFRSLDHLLPPLMQYYDIAKFYKDPNSPLACTFQYEMLKLRCEQYLDAMCHLLNTGQGVILERSPYSDFIFMETMFKFGYVNKESMDVYQEMRANIMPDLLKPHLVIYLDAPVETLQERIKKRNIPYEVNTNVLTKGYLKHMDDLYKQSYLRSIKDESELLIYDWTKFGDAEIVVEDIERIDFEGQIEDVHEPKFADWKKMSTAEWNDIRYECSTKKDYIIQGKLEFVLRYDLPELVAGSEAVEKYNEVLEKHYPYYADPAFDPAKGTSWLFRADTDYRKLISSAYRTR